MGALKRVPVEAVPSCWHKTGAICLAKPEKGATGLLIWLSGRVCWDAFADDTAWPPRRAYYAARRPPNKEVFLEVKRADIHLI